MSNIKKLTTVIFSGMHQKMKFKKRKDKHVNNDLADFLLFTYFDADKKATVKLSSLFERYGMCKVFYLIKFQLNVFLKF